jgi:hypothetical protein
MNYATIFKIHGASTKKRTSSSKIIPLITHLHPLKNNGEDIKTQAIWCGRAIKINLSPTYKRLMHQTNAISNS